MRTKRRTLAAGGLAALLLATTAPAATIVLPEERRAEILESFRTLLEYPPPGEETLRTLPDPFVFGREIEEEEEEEPPLVEGVTDEELLASIAARLSESILGYQDFGNRSFFATRDFGLLREGDTVTVTLADPPGETLTVRVLETSRSGFRIGLKDLEAFVPADATPSGIQPARP